MREDYFIQAALEESWRSTYKFPLGAIIVKRGKIVGRGYNVVCYKGDKRAFLNGTHAEIAAINNTKPEDRVGASMYVVRWRKSKTLGCAKPCDACEKVLRKLGIKYVYYSDYGNVWKRMKL